VDISHLDGTHPNALRTADTTAGGDILLMGAITGLGVGA
jgi:hypothetical protein